MTTLAVTGVSGYLGRMLCESLETDDRITRVVGIDVAEPGFGTSKLEFYRMDVRSPDLPDVIAGCDAVIHLAAVGAGSDVERVNVDGTRNVLEAAAAVNIRKIVVASSHSVYGNHPDNDLPLTEDSPLRPSPGYPASKAAAEDVVANFASAHPETTVSVLRMSWVCGQSLPGTHARVLESPVRIVIEGHEPPVQALHEDDAARALLFASKNDLPGTFNVCADDWLPGWDDYLSQPTVTLGIDQAQRWTELSARFGLSSLFPTDLGPLLHPSVMSNDRLRESGFAPSYTTGQALRAAVGAGKGWISLGRFRFRLRWLAVAAAAAAALLISSAVRGDEEPKQPSG
jgi:UDP-glucose 4-epimerase